MILKDKQNFLNYKEFYCDLTEELDQCAGFDTKKYRHYKSHEIHNQFDVLTHDLII